MGSSTTTKLKVLEAVARVNVFAPVFAARDITGDNINETFCNWFVADVADQLRLSTQSIPRHSQPRPDQPGVKKPVSANRLYAYFNKQSSKPDGHWRQVSKRDAVRAARAGQFVVASKQASGHGHIAVVLPTSTGSTIMIAQAGKNNTSSAPLNFGFGNKTPSFFVYNGQ